MDIILHKFEFGNLINVIKKAKAHKKEDLIICKPFDENSIPYVTRTEPNNSVECFIKNTKELKIEKGNAIVVGDTTATVSYQLQPFVAGDHIVVIYADWLNQWTGLYITCLLNKERYKYCYGRAYVVDSIKSTSIYLPSKLDDNNQYIPDWQYIEKYMKKHLVKIPQTKNTTPKYMINTENWHFFKVGQLFKLETGKVSSTEVLTEGEDVFYCGAKKDENGIMSRCAYDKKYISKGNCIVFICDGQGAVGYNNYMDRDFIATVNLVMGYNDNLNKYNGLFLVSLLDLERPKFSFGRKRKKTLANTEIKLPAKLNSKNEYEPDWQYMEDYIKSLPYGDVI